MFLVVRTNEPKDGDCVLRRDSTRGKELKIPVWLYTSGRAITAHVPFRPPEYKQSIPFPVRFHEESALGVAARRHL